MEALTLLAALSAIPLPLSEPVEAILARFPDKQTADACREIAVAHVRWLENEIAVFPSRAEDFDEWLSQAKRYKSAWQYLCSAHWNYPGNANCVYNALEELRMLIGEENYLAGRMPPPMPYWFFTELGR